MSNYERYVAAFAEALEMEPEEINASLNVKDSEQWTSMSHITLMSALEDAFDILLDPDDILEFDSFQKGIELLAKHGVEIKKEES